MLKLSVFKPAFLICFLTLDRKANSLTKSKILTMFHSKDFNKVLDRLRFLVHPTPRALHPRMFLYTVLGKSLVFTLGVQPQEFALNENRTLINFIILVVIYHTKKFDNMFSSNRN